MESKVVNNYVEYITIVLIKLIIKNIDNTGICKLFDKKFCCVRFFTSRSNFV